MKKLDRGTFQEKVGTVDGVEIKAIKWLDSKLATAASTYAGANPCGTLERWHKKQKKHVQVPCPYAHSITSSWEV